MGHPRAAIVGKRKEVCSGNRVRAENVLAGFEMPPEVAVAQWPCREEERVGKNVHFKNLSERVVH